MSETKSKSPSWKLTLEINGYPRLRIESDGHQVLPEGPRQLQMSEALLRSISQAVTAQYQLRAFSEPAQTLGDEVVPTFFSVFSDGNNRD